MDLEVLMENFGLDWDQCTVLLVAKGNWELQIDYKLKNGTESYLHYKKFAVGSAEDQYQLNISGFDSIGQTNLFTHNYGQLNGINYNSHHMIETMTCGCIIVQTVMVDFGIILVVPTH